MAQDSGAEQRGASEHLAGSSASRVLTIPNALSVVRLLGVPVFLWAVLTRRDGLALAVVMIAGWTDYFDGKLARWLDQESHVGRLLDPAADRLYILATLIGLTIRDIVPLALTASLLVRDALLTLCLVLLYRRGFQPLQVHFLGKAATFNLLYAFPLLLLGDGTGMLADVSGVVGWAFAIWGAGLYWWAGILYASQVRSLLVSAPQHEPAEMPGESSVNSLAGEEATPVGQHDTAAAPPASTFGAGADGRAV